MRLDFGNPAAKSGNHFQSLFARYNNVFAFNMPADSKPAVDLPDHAQIMRIRVTNPNFSAGYGRGADEATHLHKISADSVLATMQTIDTLDGNPASADTFNLSA